MGVIAPGPSPATWATRVLVVDGEPQLVRGLTILLRGVGYVVDSARTADEALADVAEHPPDVLLLDLAVPHGGGTAICREVRRVSNVQILLMATMGGRGETLRALHAGADDYLPKPFRAEELLSRLNRMLAGSAGIAASSRLEIGELTIDLVRRRVTRAGTVLLLEPTEFELVRVLAQGQRRIVTDRELLRAVWGEKRGQDTHRLRVTVARLRAKLERDPSRVEYLIAEPGIGYRLGSPGQVLR
jgi:two-component system, OmpR family, KDP operon response regulator KdpE